MADLGGLWSEGSARKGLMGVGRGAERLTMYAWANDSS